MPPVPGSQSTRTPLEDDGRGPRPFSIEAGHYQHIVLNTVSGELSFHCADHRRSSQEDGYYPGTLFAPDHSGGVPKVLYWNIDSGVSERPHHDVSEANAFAIEVAPLAQILLDHLVLVPETNTLGWSAEAVSAGLDIGRACTRHRLGPKGRRAWIDNSFWDC
ncbi:hypothetical protein [Streptomyces sp. RKAG337]|uniref:hypothetical protein n=1 Tax=Streptomyces sp. RKAG337 TaxID=2893404 RepID=UPI00203320F2|nr:hypothetical protein [Streptomyces sp. RKAG337]MCM2424894.1 hypothetical protein [Streptomyces sp. RKAG337]